jgi:hypothetical protein
MEIALLGKLFGGEARWQGSCTILLDSDAGIQALGADSIGAGATKSYAPRLVSCRIVADSVCLLSDGSALLAIQNSRFRQSTGEEVLRQTLLVIDPKRVVAVEFADMGTLAALGVTPPPTRPLSHAGINLRPGYDRA